MTHAPSPRAGVPSNPGHAGNGALVTGAGRGLGRAIATALARRGDRVVLTDYDEALVSAAAASLRSEGLDVYSDRLDVSDESSVVDVVNRWDAQIELGTVVANAGVAASSPLAETSLAEFDRIMNVNVRGGFLILREAVRVMQPRRRGNIVSVASTSSFTASSTPMLAYDTSKAAVRMMTMAAARELGPFGVRVNAVAPGTMDTQLVRGLFADELSTEDLASSRIPLGRLGSTDEVANAVVFLSSPEASYVTGHTLVVDGGWLT